jgi:hypothetical protein
VKAKAKAPAFLEGLTGEAVLKKAAGQKQPFAEFGRLNPDAGAEMFDLTNAKPAIEGRPMLPRYDPARGTSDRVADALASRKVKNRLTAAAERGAEMMPESWYRTGPLFERFQQEMSDPEKAYELLMGLVAATSPRSRVPDNIRQASYYNNFLARNGMPIPDRPAPGYGSVAQKLHVQNVRNVLGPGLDPLQNPKPASFVENLLGNEQPVTIDTHNFRALGMASEDPRFLATSVQVPRRMDDGTEVYDYVKPQEMYNAGELTMKDALKRPTYWATAPNANEYKAYEDAQHKMAAKVGMSPARFQETMWVGAGPTTGLGSPPEPFLRTLASRIHYTAAQMGADPEVVLQKFVKGQIPLLSATGALLWYGAGTGTGPAPADAGQR